MKIALTHMRHADVGGTELYLNQIARALAERGHEVTIVCRSHAATPHPAVRFVVLRPWALGRAHRLWRFARDVAQHVDTHGYDLVFGLGRTWTQDVLRFGAGLYREQINQGREHWRLWPKDLIANMIERRALALGKYRLVIANSQQTANSLRQHYNIATEQIVTIHNAVDTARFNPSLRLKLGMPLREQYGFTPEHQVYLFLGSGYRRKGLDRLLHAFVEVSQHSALARLLVVGFDNQQRRYQALAEDLGLADKVVWLGGRRDPEVCYNAADCYVMPTRFDAFGFSALEAMACGLPVVITDTAGAAELVTPDVGQVIPGDQAYSQQQLVEAMLQFAEQAKSPLLRVRCEQQAAQYALGPVMARTVRLLESVASRQHTNDSAPLQPGKQAVT